VGVIVTLPIRSEKKATPNRRKDKIKIDW